MAACESASILLCSSLPPLRRLERPPTPPLRFLPSHLPRARSICKASLVLCAACVETGSRSLRLGLCVVLPPCTLCKLSIGQNVMCARQRAQGQSSLRPSPPAPACDQLTPGRTTMPVRTGRPAGARLRVVPPPRFSLSACIAAELGEALLGASEGRREVAPRERCVQCRAHHRVEVAQRGRLRRHRVRSCVPGSLRLPVARQAGPESTL